MTRWLGYPAGAGTVLLWIMLVFINPYSTQINRSSIVITFIMLLLPALLFAAGLAMQRGLLLLIAFLWSLPYSLYMAMSPGVFLLFGFTCLLYLLCYVLFTIFRMSE